MRDALIVIDIQNFFITDSMSHLPAKIADLIRSSKFDFVLFSRFVNNPESNFYKSLQWEECEESPDIDIHPDVDEFADETNTFDKTTFSIFKSDITQYLYDNQIQKVYLCGVDFDACVISSAYEGFDLGFKIEVLSEYCLSSGGDIITKPMVEIVRRNLTNQASFIK